MQKISEQTFVCPAEALRRRPRITGLTRVLGGILFLALLLHPGRAFSAALPSLYDLNLAWDASPSPEVAGHHLYFGVVSGEYTAGLGTGDVAAMTVSGLLSGATYYFAITAIGLDGLESDFSNEISYGQGISSLQIQGVAGGQFMLTVGGTTGHTYDIEATQDFSTWSVIGTVTMGTGGSLDFTDTTAASYPQRFYRTRDPQP